MNKLKVLNEQYLIKCVWVLRVLVGATFILSGVVKAIDLWGFVYKIEQYLNVWGVPQTHTLVLFAAVCISFLEFVLGVLLLTGSYKRSSAWLLLCSMVFMLPLSMYIAIANPVEDCGCFGDFLIISNTATLIKNIVLTAALVYLSIFNSRVLGLYSRYIQWFQALILLIFISIIGYEGYSIQPLLDFRPYKIGTQINNSNEGNSDNYNFIYEKNGIRQVFNIDNLPDSSWVFIDRVNDESEHDEIGFSVFDNDEDVTSEVLDSVGNLILLVIPNTNDINIAYTYFINEMSRYITAHSGKFIGLIAADSVGIEEWKDISLATYPVYSVEDTSLKELVRGQMAMVSVEDGIIKWKRTILSIDPTICSSKTDFSSLYINGEKRFIIISTILIIIMITLWLINRGGYIVKWYIYRKKQK